mmetsp:Transcript_102157/g.256037  ORF Transcript_102157/g.256037 Transcript_102157/m.256037 type:complete len:146 (+) Transcript_102157:131-568(+)
MAVEKPTNSLFDILQKGPAVDGEGVVAPVPVTVEVDGVEEVVHVDPKRGPHVLPTVGLAAGYTGGPNDVWVYKSPVRENLSAGGYLHYGGAGNAPPKQWPEMTYTEKKIALTIVARKNRKLRELVRGAGDTPVQWGAPIRGPLPS